MKFQVVNRSLKENMSREHMFFRFLKMNYGAFFMGALLPFVTVAAPVEYAYRITSPKKIYEKTKGSLNDGSVKTGAYWKGRSGVVICELPSPTEVASVAVTLSKHTNWFLMKSVDVAVDSDGSGAFSSPRSVPVPVAGFDGKGPVVDESCTNMTVRIPVGERAVRVKVRIRSLAWSAVREIVLDDGKSRKEVAASALRNGKKTVASAVKKKPTAEAAALPSNLTKVENRFFKMLVSPLGGRVLSLRSKFLDAELTDLHPETGTFSEFDWSRRGNRFFYRNKPFMLKEFKGEGSVGLEARGNVQGGGTDFLVIDKKYTLLDDATAFKVDYNFGNLQAAMSPQTYGLLIHSTLGIHGRLCSYYYPTDEGIVEVERDKRPQERWIHHPSRGWMAAVDDLGRGVAITMPFREVKSFYSWYAQDVVPTLEWRMIPVEIENGKSYSVSTEVIAFKGLKKVSGAGGGLVGEISNGKVKVFNSRKGKVVAKAGSKVVPLDFSGIGEVRTFSSDATTVILEKDGTEVCRLEAPPAKGAWSIAALEQSRISDMKSFDLTGYTNFPHQVCVPFAKPLAAKRPRVIALTFMGNNVELGFFADRFDCELLTTSIGIEYYRKRPEKRSIKNPLYENGDYFGALSTADVEENLVKTLKKEADVILVGGLPWEIFPKEAQKLIIEKVKAGCGLVWIGQDRDAPEIFRKGCENKMALGIPVPVTDEFSDVPFALLGKEPSYRFNAAGAVVHANVDGAPYLTENTLGKGTVLHLPYKAVFGNLNNTSGITPNLRDFYPDRTAPVEHYYSLIAKCIVRAAHIDLPAKFGKVSFSRGRASCRIKANSALRGNLRWTVRNRFGRELAGASVPVSLKKGDNALAVMLDGLSPAAGPLAFDAVLCGEDGRVAAWGGWSFELTPKAKLCSLDANRSAAKGEAYRESEIVELSASLAGDVSGRKVVFGFRDSFGRLLEEKTVPASAKVKASFRIANELPARMYEAAARLLDGEREIDRLRVEVRARPEPSKWPKDDFAFGVWTAERVREYLWPEFAGLFRKMHLVANVANPWRMAMEFPARHGFEPTLLASAGLGRCNEPEEYVNTGDKLKLVRSPCLSDPAFLARQEKELPSVAKRIANVGVRYVWFGDEQSLTGYDGKPIDFCFSPHCLAAFREFLKARYGTISRLNAEWETKFSDWKAVVPFTRQEVWAPGGARHVAGWADHLEFMDGRLSNSLAYAAELLKAGDDNVATSISGTQPPTAYGGMDWWKQIRVLGGALSYMSGGQLDIHRSFKPDGDFMPWNWGYSQVGETQIYAFWIAVFGGARGISGYHDVSIFNPDWTWSRGYADVKPSMDRVAEGLGKHLINNRAFNSEIAILYSQSSVRAAFFENREKQHKALREKYVTLLRHLGLAFDFVSYEQLENGVFESRGYKALILADACAMADGEIAAVKRFSAKGGIVVAEGVPARLQGNCRPRTSSPLAGCVTMLAEKPDTRYQGALAYPFDEKQSAVIAAEQDRLERALGPVASAVPRLKIFDATDGKRFRVASIWPRKGRNGELFWGVISNEKGASRLVDFAFPKKGVVYDLVSGKEIGVGDRFRLPLSKSRAYAFELLDERPAEPALSAEGGRVKIICAKNVDTVVRLRVFAPSGEEAWYYAKKLVVKNGMAETVIPFALSDAKGKWRIVATDVVTGAEKSVEIIR